VVSRLAGATITAEELLTEMRKTLAAYQCPRHVLFVDAVYRSPSGKADYNITRDIALNLLKG
jgi:fatty-acyl-CoA synthase